MASSKYATNIATFTPFNMAVVLNKAWPELDFAFLRSTFLGINSLHRPSTIDGEVPYLESTSTFQSRAPLRRTAIHVSNVQ